MTDAMKPLMRVLAGERVDPPPIWLMRQAGRYLPEYRETRARAKTFLDFCYAPALCAEVAFQPLRRYDFDAAIVFSDILVIPDALGVRVSFEDGEGPRLAPVSPEAVARLDPAQVTTRLGPVYEALERTRAGLSPHQALIGFAGSPWTLAVYMIQGAGGRDHTPARVWAMTHRDAFARLLEVLAEAIARHLEAQVRAGAEALQLFDSWSDGLSDAMFAEAVLAPTARVLARLKHMGVTAPVIGFPRGCGAHLARYAELPGLAAIGVDTSQPGASVQALPKGLAAQGAVDPAALIAGGAALEASVDASLRDFSGRPHIFNLGHGILPQTPPDHVASLVRRVRGG